MKLAVFALALLAPACVVTESYGRLPPLTDYERQHMSCDDFDLEIAKAEAQVAQLDEQTVTAALPLDLGIGNAVERRASLKAAKARLFELQLARFDKGCPGATKPVPEPKPTSHLRGISPAQRAALPKEMQTGGM